MLLQLRDYILREQVVSSQQLARELHVDLSTLEPMLEFWVKKGKIAAIDSNLKCQSSCSGCHSTKVVFYRSQN